MEYQAKQVIIFALNRSTQAQDIQVLEERGIPFIPCIGCYKGDKEWSYLVDAEYLDSLRLLLKEHNQESVLYLDNQRNAFLLYASTNYTEPEYLGRLRETSQAMALKEDAYTYNMNTDKFYTVA